MTDLDSALAEAASVLEECSVPFMLIGGLAVAAWGEARSAGRTIPVVSVEDLVLMKLVSERQKDMEDARALPRRFGKPLDRECLAPKGWRSAGDQVRQFTH